MFRQFVYLSLVFAGVLSGAFAAEPELQPGEYVTERGWGTLTIELDQGQGSRFSISAVGANGHVCDVEGNIKDGKAIPEHDNPDRPCVVGFLLKGQDIDVSANDRSNCHRHCGARAQFLGLYLKPAPGCETKAIAGRREAFKRAYDQKSFSEARKILEPVLRLCIRTLDEIEEAWIRNDLAITQYRLGEATACLETLRPLVAHAEKTEEQIHEERAPADADNLYAVARAARTNLRLCRNQLSKRAK